MTREPNDFDRTILALLDVTGLRPYAERLVHALNKFLVEKLGR